MNYQKTLLLAFFMFSAIVLKAQSPDTASANARMAAGLSVSREKASQIREALTFRQDELRKLITDKSLSPETKRAKIAGLQKERQHRIDAVLTPQQKALLAQHYSELSKSIAARRAAIERRPVTDTSRTPHKAALNSQSRPYSPPKSK
jgi:hypothetical protein